MMASLTVPTFGRFSNIGCPPSSSGLLMSSLLRSWWIRSWWSWDHLGWGQWPESHCHWSMFLLVFLAMALIDVIVRRCPFWEDFRLTFYEYARYYVDDASQRRALVMVTTASLCAGCLFWSSWLLITLKWDFFS